MDPFDQGSDESGFNPYELPTPGPFAGGYVPPLVLEQPAAPMNWMPVILVALGVGLVLAVAEA